MVLLSLNFFLFFFRVKENSFFFFVGFYVEKLQRVEHEKATGKERYQEEEKQTEAQKGLQKVTSRSTSLFVSVIRRLIGTYRFISIFFFFLEKETRTVVVTLVF